MNKTFAGKRIILVTALIVVALGGAIAAWQLGGPSAPRSALSDASEELADYAQASVWDFGSADSQGDKGVFRIPAKYVTTDTQSGIRRFATDDRGIVLINDFYQCTNWEEQAAVVRDKYNRSEEADRMTMANELATLAMATLPQLGITVDSDKGGELFEHHFYEASIWQLRRAQTNGGPTDVASVLHVFYQEDPRENPITFAIAMQFRYQHLSLETVPGPELTCRAPEGGT